MSSSLLNVEQSLNQARWILPQSEQAVVERIAREHDLPEIVARLLNVRGVKPEEVDGFLHPKLAQHFPDPFSMAGMEAFANYAVDAIKAGKKFAVFGDFDVDGATSTAIFVRFFRHLGIEVPFYIPDRLKEGYGPNENALRVLKDNGADIVLMCDCGITAFDVIKSGRDMGLEICVFDHHESEDKLPEANHVVNPKRKDDNSGLDMLAACGVVFMTCVALNAKLREGGYYKEKAIAEAPLKDLLDILALGTVCDMVPLQGANRLFVRSGFKQMALKPNLGIKMLCETAGLKGEPNTYHAGFVLGPRINAGSRVHKADLGAQLLSTDDAEEARNIAWTLNDCNEKRKEIQEEMLVHAINMVEDGGMQNDPIIVVGDESWHPGLSGLVAGRLREKYDKPAVCITFAPGPENALEGRGSGRSVPGINMGGAFIEARNKGILLKGGGHAMAAGFTVEPDKIDALREFLVGEVQSQLEGNVSLSETGIDSILSVRGATPDFVRIIRDHIGPFGQGNDEPVFVLPNVRLHMVDVVGTDHVRAMVGDWEGGSRMKAMAFRSADTPMGQALLKQSQNQPFHIAGTLKLDNWNGQERVEMHITDAAYVGEEDARKLAAG